MSKRNQLRLNLMVKANDKNLVAATKGLQYELLEDSPLYQGFFQLRKYQLRVQKYDGTWSNSYTREIFERGDAVAALLLDVKREAVVLVEQFRPGAIKSEHTPWLVELVAGMFEAGESPEAVLIRECQEEANLKPTRVQKISEYLVSPGGTTERIYLYLAEVDASNIREQGGLPEEEEDIRVRCVPVNQAFEWLRCGQINNAMTLIALQWLKLNWSQRHSFWQ